jgi:hypothetical protein
MDPPRLYQNRESRYLTIAGNQMCREGGGEHFSKQLEEWGVSLPRLSGGRRRTSHTLEPAGGQVVTLLHPLSTRNTLTALYKEVASSKDGAITNVYGPQSMQDKERFIRSLHYVQTLIHTPHWIIGGDFNMILTLEEKVGGSKRLE